MPGPIGSPLSEEELITAAHAVIRNARFPQLATVEGDQPRVRPVSPVRVEGFTIFIANLRRYGKTAEISANPKVELNYLDERHDQVRITGVAQVVTDPVVLAQIWGDNPLLRKYLGTPDNPDLVIYRVEPNRVRFMHEWALEYQEVPLTPSPLPAH